MAKILSVFSAILLAQSAVGQDQCKISQDRSSLNCFLRTLQSELKGEGNHVNSVRKLHVRCSDAFFFESQLKSEHFGQLPMLEELHIDYCKIRHLPPRSFAGLSNLQRLSIQSHNSEWTSILMDVDVNAFRQLDSLKELNMAHNNLWSLPINALCDLPKIKVLNMSNNHLLDVVDLGLSFQEGCKIDSLSGLDLSRNHIASLRSGDLVQARSLQRLNLRANRLSIMDDDALKALPQLREIDLSNNQLAALPPTIFNNSLELEKLFLQNNSLTLLTSELFAPLKNLQVLNLSKNAISSHLLTPETFSGLSNLQVLDLSYNQLNKIDGSTFESMTELQVLNLEHNQIHLVSASAFTVHSNLRFLIMSHNRIERLHRDVLVNLSNLTSLSLDYNRFDSFDLNATTTTTVQLKDLALNNNRLKMIPEFVKECKQLSTLDLGDNNIEQITGNDFNSLSNLYGLRLAGNNIKSISNDTFSNVTNLHVLNLARNQLEEIEQGTFNNLQELLVLRLDDNSLADINGIVSSLSKLEWFNVSSNQLEWFDYAFVPSSLQWLDMSSNQVGELGNFYDLKNFEIRTLDASNNLITKINEDSFPRGLKHIILNNNVIHEVGSNTFAELKTLEVVQLKNNLIQNLQREALSTTFSTSVGKWLQTTFSVLSSNCNLFHRSSTKPLHLFGWQSVCLRLQFGLDSGNQWRIKTCHQASSLSSPRPRFGRVDLHFANCLQDQ